MRKSIFIKFFSRLLLVVLLTVLTNDVHESTHSMQGHITAASNKASYSEIAVSHHCPCNPLKQHKDFDGCDSFIHCACHAPLIIKTFQVNYNPFILDHLYTPSPSKFLPKVYLSLFVPPDSATI